METWISNGAQLAWLVDPDQRNALIYEPGQPAHLETGDKVIGTGPVKGFALDLCEVWKLYED